MPDHKTIQIGPSTPNPVSVSNSGALTIFAGPCVIESAELVMQEARAVVALARELGVQVVFKASFDKANRTAVTNFRGPGLKEGLELLAEIKSELGVPVVTDIHTPLQAAQVGEVVDVVQIPAFLCRQTDILVEAGATGKPVNVKKGQFFAPDLMRHCVAKVNAGAERAGVAQNNVLLTERGTTFGYGDLVVDMRSFSIMAETGCPVVFDVTHSVQRPGGRGDSSGGDAHLAPALARAAVAAGVRTLFIETHHCPSEALCDATTMLSHEELREMLLDLKRIVEVL